MIYSKIQGVGAYVPQQIYDNTYMEKIVDTSDEWITQRTGIKERHIAAKDEFTTDLATKVANNAIVNAGITPEDIDLIICNTVTPDYFTPSCACVVQSNVGAVNAAAFDINAACSGFVTGLVTGTQFIQNGVYKTVLVISSDVLSKATDYKDRNTCVLFGDAAGAAILTASNEPGVLSSWIGAKGSDGKQLTSLAYREDELEIEKRISKRKHDIWQNGRKVMKFAVKIMADAVAKVIADAGLTTDDIDLIIPHQANVRIVDNAVERMGIAHDKVFMNIQKYGNTSGASIINALTEAVQEGRAERGNNIVLVGFGGGLTWGAAVVKWAI